MGWVSWAQPAAIERNDDCPPNGLPHHFLPMQNPALIINLRSTFWNWDLSHKSSASVTCPPPHSLALGGPPRNIRGMLFLQSNTHRLAIKPDGIWSLRQPKPAAHYLKRRWLNGSPRPHPAR